MPHEWVVDVPPPRHGRNRVWEPKFKKVATAHALRIEGKQDVINAMSALRYLQRRGEYLHLEGRVIDGVYYIFMKRRA